MKRIFIPALVLAAATVLGGQRPARVMSGYTGYFLGGMGREHVEKMIDFMGENGFNAIDVKVHSSLPKKKLIDNCWQEVKPLVDRAHAKGLAFNVYLYPFRRRKVAALPEFAALPCPVDALGNKMDTTYLMSDPGSWRVFFSEALRFAALRKQLGFDSLRFDVEVLPMNNPTSYDDGTWSAFCAENPGFDPATPASGRLAALGAKNAKAKYAEFHNARVKAAAVDFVKTIRAIDPEIELGYMPARPEALCGILAEILAAPGVPAWIDGWDLYNGSGYRPAVKARAEAMRKANPENRFIAWICPNRYKPEDVASSVYHAAVNTSGYSIWTLGMLDDSHRYSKGLPKGATCADYWAAFKKANEALRADMAEGTIEKGTRIPYVKVKPMVANLSWDGVKAPALVPAGDGSGENAAVTLRNTHNVFVYAKAGEPMNITLKHLAGEKRPTGLQYVLLSPSGKMMRNEAVTAGEKHSFSVTAEETGVHVLRATGGDIGGAPWYSVSVAAPLHWAVDASKEAYMFRATKFYVDGADAGNPRMHVRMHQSCCKLSINGVERELVRLQDADFDLPPEVAEVKISMSEAGYGENYFISFPGGKSRLVFPVKERRLKFAK